VKESENQSAFGKNIVAPFYPDTVYNRFIITLYKIKTGGDFCYKNTAIIFNTVHAASRSLIKIEIISKTQI